LGLLAPLGVGDDLLGALSTSLAQFRFSPHIALDRAVEVPLTPE
jgi:hypothetical protein